MIADIFKHTLMITGFVFVMMLVIEYLNVLTRGGWDRMLGKWKWGQIVLASFLGATPGCMGAYAVGSLYMHRVVTFGALMAAMVATCGDETFIMLAMFPEKTVLILGILFGLGIVSGITADVLLKGRRTHIDFPHHDYHASHDDEARCVPFSGHELIRQWRKCTPERGLLTLLLVLFLGGVMSGSISHGHLGVEPAAVGITTEDVVVDGHHHDECVHQHAHHGCRDWMSITLLIAGAIGLAIVVTVPDHFLSEHLWGHLVRVHVWRIFLWTLGSLLVVRLMLDHVDLNALIGHDASLTVLLFACIIGLIPESGPHLIFVMLYAEGAIAFSVLLANSIVQDGHGMIPMIAHSRRTFAAIKAGKLLLGLIVGLAGYCMGW